MFPTVCPQLWSGVFGCDYGLLTANFLGDSMVLVVVALYLRMLPLTKENPQTIVYTFLLVCPSIPQKLGELEASDDCSLQRTFG